MQFSTKKLFIISVLLLVAVCSFAQTSKAKVKQKPKGNESGEVIDFSKGGKKLFYGQLAPKAALLPVPKDVKLKDAKAWKIIGKSVKRLDTPAKVTGKAEYGIDVQLPGMLIASLAQCPVLGGKPLSVDDAKAKSMPGVMAVVKITGAPWQDLAQHLLNTSSDAAMRGRRGPQAQSAWRTPRET